MTVESFILHAFSVAAGLWLYRALLIFFAAFDYALEALFGQRERRP